MSDYDFSSLNDKDFEELAVDLLSAEFDKRVERFKSGKDGGVDGRFFNLDGDEQIIQCKHWIKSGLSALIKSLSTTELAKVEKLNPQKYFLVTSLSLSRANKTRIKNIFGDYIEKENQILGKEDLNDLLKKHPNIERAHYKLWISSTTVLETILNADVIGTSRYKLEEINNKSTKYVVTESHDEAIHILEKNGTLIISGLPGIGKTTLADQICRNYLAQGFEFYYIEDSVFDVDKVYKEEVKQIFYFDDFLGSNYLEAIGSREDSKIASFIRRVEKNKNKRFVLTSRTNILNQGKRLSTAFEVQNIDKNEYELIVRNLKPLDKAKILYNHIFFSDLSDIFIDQLYLNERYKDIINHKNYNPRVISFITDSQRLVSISSENYWSYIVSVLDDPSQIWGNVFDRQTGDIAKDLVSMIVLNKGRISETELKELYYKLCSERKEEHGKTFIFEMKALAGSLVNRNILRNETYYDLFNPSITDFITQNYFSNKYYILRLLNVSQSVVFVESLIDLVKNNILNKEIIKYVFNEFLLNEVEGGKFNLNFWSKFSLISLGGFLEIKQIKEILETTKVELLNNKNYAVKSFKFLSYLVDNCLISINDFNSVKDEIENEFLGSGDYYCLSNLSHISNKLKLDEGSGFHIKLKSEILDYFYMEVTSMVIQDNVIDGVYSLENFEEEIITNYISSILETEFPIKFSHEDIGEISSCLDVDDAIQANMNSSYDHEYDRGDFKESSSGVAYVDPITDLFDRS